MSAVHPPSRPIVVADIGATHARFGLLDGNDVDAIAIYPTAAAQCGDELLERYLAEVGIARPGGVCLAVAGPVHEGVGALTNSTIGFAQAELEARFGAPVRVLNDFAAVAAAIPFLATDALVPLARPGGACPEPAQARTKAVIGPGSGLGMAAVLPHAGRWLVLPTEGGHCDLPATDALEAEIVTLLRAGGEHVPLEACLSGPGLLTLYRAVCSIWGCDPEHATPEAVTERAADGDPVCHQTVEVFWGMLGNAAGNLALMMGADGGVLVAGGIVPALVDQLDPVLFRRRFEQRGVLTQLAQRIPTAVVVEPTIGLRGAGWAFAGDVEFIG
jgi:glucokinase